MCNASLKVVAPLLVFLLPLHLLGEDQRPQPPAIVPAISIDQDELLSGQVSFRKLVESGRHLFSTPFTTADGMSEGGLIRNGVRQLGPRERDFNESLSSLSTRLKLDDAGFTELRAVVKPQFAQLVRLDPQDPKSEALVFTFLRLNGLDSQSCFECHNSIGSARLTDTRSEALGRKVGVTGGPAGFASNAFINGANRDDSEAIVEPGLPNPLFKFVRNPPHVFGTGYAQAVAEEMSIELMGQRYYAVGKAVADPGKKIVQPLSSKGIDYGALSVTYKGAAALAGEGRRSRIHASLDADDPNFEFDYDSLRGVSEDLTVRPFQWKGIASNERNFVRDALGFHFGMEAIEKFLKDPDHDRDGVETEVTIGNVTALTVFTMSIRPPNEVVPEDPEVKHRAELGRRIFLGREKVAAKESCSSCHVPSLHLSSPEVVVRDPRQTPDEFVGHGVGLSAQLKSRAQLPVVRRFNKLRGDLRLDEHASSEQALAPLKRALVAAGKNALLDGYRFNLTTLEPAVGAPSAPMSLTQPRLPDNPDGSVDVPLFSDLKRHDMGDGLKDIFRQGTDVAEVSVKEREFLTRPLWGVADTGPWLHDGRARTLREAIMLHRSTGSEANPVIDAFEKVLNEDEQQAVIQFLLTLRLPLDNRYSFDTP